MGKRRLESGFSAARIVKYELAMAGDAGWAGNGGSVVRSIGMEQRDVHRQRNTRARTEPAAGPADWLWYSRRALSARQCCLRRHAAIERLSCFANASQQCGYGNTEGRPRSARH